MEADMAHELAAVMCFALKYLNFYIYFYNLQGRQIAADLK